MSEHMWLTEKEIRSIEDENNRCFNIGPPDVDCLIADWREMRRLCERIWAMDTPAEHTATWWAVKAMLKATADKPMNGNSM